jgi:predicted MFS family arabinose efflux permease
MAADGLRAIVLVILVATIAGGHVSIAIALVAIGLLTTAEVFADGTSTTLLPMLVDREDLPIANARLTSGFITLNQLAGPPIGAALFVVGRAVPYATQAVLVAFGVLLVSRVRLPAHGRERGTGRGLRRDIADGFRWTLRHPAVRTLALTNLIFNVTYGAAFSVLVLYVRDRLGLGPVGYGLLTTATALGGLLATGAYGWITRRISLGDVMRIGLVIETLTHLGLALTRSPWVAAVILFVFGAHEFVWGTTATTVRQRAVPRELQGRVGSVYTIAIYAGLVVGSGVGGLLANRFGLTAPFWFAFGGSVVFLVLLWPQLTRIAHGGDDAGAPASGHHEA